MEDEERERAEAAEREAQENLRAKMALFPESDDDDQLVDGFLGDLPDPASEGETPLDVATPEPVRTGPPPTTNSLLAQRDMIGKKIKVSASKQNGVSTSKVTTTTIVTAPVSSFTPVNRPKPKAIDLSDSESDDNIPASAPAPKRPVGRPPGRPSMVPTRGNLGKRGRGRPRKTM
jgi:hypothetical protein